MDPTFQVDIHTDLSGSRSMVANGFYQQYFQLLNTKIRGNSGYEYWENYVCSLRYTADSMTSVSSIDYFSDISCGLTQLSDITDGNYRARKGPEECADPWYKNYEASEFGNSSVDCSFYRDFTYHGAFLLDMGQTVTFRTGFNVFGTSTDVEADVAGYSPNLQYIIVDSARMLAAGVSFVLSALII